MLTKPNTKKPTIFNALPYISYYQYHLTDKIRISKFEFINRPFQTASRQYIRDNMRLKWRFYGFNYGAAFFNFFYLVHKGLWGAVLFNLLLTMTIMPLLIALQSLIGFVLPQYTMTVLFALCCGFSANIFLLLKSERNIESIMIQDNREREKKGSHFSPFAILEKVNRKFSGMQFLRLMISPFYMAAIFYLSVLLSHPLLLQSPSQAFEETRLYFRMLTFLIMFG